MIDFILVKQIVASGALTKRRFFKLNSDFEAVQASASTDDIVGVVGDSDIADTAVGEVFFDGIQLVQAGATGFVGDMLTSDANGKAVPLDETNDGRVGAIALQDFTTDDIILCKLISFRYTAPEPIGP